MEVLKVGVTKVVYTNHLGWTISLRTYLILIVDPYIPWIYQSVGGLVSRNRTCHMLFHWRDVFHTAEAASVDRREERNCY